MGSFFFCRRYDTFTFPVKPPVPLGSPVLISLACEVSWCGGRTSGFDGVWREERCRRTSQRRRVGILCMEFQLRLSEARAGTYYWNGVDLRKKVPPTEYI